jgi:3-oxo-5-alpha-steroid 4-dehydrogenase 3
MAECGIYLSLVLLQAPDEQGRSNWSLLCALVFVIVNLGVTADETKKWMMAKFPERRKEIEMRWRMIALLW